MDENFFALGGDSLLAIQCVSRLRDKNAIRLTLTDFFENGTVAEQATLIRKRQAAAHLNDQSLPKTSSGQLAASAAPKADAQTIPLRDRSLPYRLSPLQERLWFMERLNPGQPVYNEVEAVRLRGDLNAEALERALNVVIARHEILRTTIHAVDGLAMAEVRESYLLRLKMIDLTGRPEAEREVELERLQISEPRIPYHLENEPAIRATLIRMDDQDHVFILMMHHLVCDWSSEGVLWRELSALYRSYCRNEALALPALTWQHGDYAVWERQQSTKAAVADDLAFWVENLRGAAPLLELPSDRPRPQVLFYRGARHRFRLNRTLTEAFRQLSRRERKSLFALFTAALDALLYRYTGQEDILLGIPIAERDRPECQSMIGFLLHTHVLRTEVKGELTFRELVGRVQQAALNLYEHRSVPFDHVVRAVQPERSLSYSPLFQVMVNWRDRDQNLCFIGMEGLNIESVLVDSKISKFDLTLFLTDMGEEVWAEIEYSTDLFDPARIERMFGHYQTVLEAVAADPDQRLSELPLLPHAERRQLLVQWNNTKVDYPSTTSIQEPFEAQAARTPDRVALVFERQTLSYGELNRRANQLAHHLRGLGVGPNMLVGLCVKRSLDMAVGLLGILKSGAAYVPMDPVYPKERLQYILDDSNASVVLTQESLVDALPSFSGQLICLDKDWAKIARESDKNPGAQLNPENLAYVLFTSGSSGKPKGVEISHRAVVNFLNSMREVPGVTAQDTLLSVTTLSFDIFGLEIWLPLTSGAKVVIASEEVARDGKELAALMRQSGATIMQATPSTWRLLLEAGWEGNPHLKILCGGEAWPDELAEQLLPKCSALWNMYGPTETTIWSAVHQVRAGMPVSIGHPIANTEFYVVDSHLQPVPVGVPGELLIGGAGLARGYLNRPDLTTEKFIADRFRPDAGSRLYRTGDLVRYREDGTLEFLQRIDQQVKIRGFRIELGEIESVLRSHPGVREAVAVVPARGEARGEKQLTAYVVPAGKPACTTAELRDYLKQKLPAYMVPAAFSVLESLPLTPNGKIDRKALSGKGYASVEGLSEYDFAYDWTLPRKTLLEAQLLQIWQEVLGARYMGVRDSFFDLGGHSLLALKMIDKVNKLFDVSLSVPTFFMDPTIEGIAHALEQENNLTLAPKAVPLQPGRTEGTIFFFDASVGLCRLAELLREGPASFAVSSMLPQSILEVARGNRTAQSVRLEDMAAPLVKLIEAQRKSGPCVLVGYCWSGNLAFEAAHQLRQNGVPVDLIVLVDAWQTAPSLWQRLTILSREQALSASKWRMRYLWETTKRLAGRMFGTSESSETRGPAVGGADVETGVQIKIFHTVRNYYQCRPIEASGLLIRARDDRFSQLRVTDGKHGWGKFFQGELVVVDVPGNHLSMLAESNISNISHAIQKCLSPLINQQESQRCA